MPSPQLVEYARRAASQDDMREAIRLQALANEMRDVFEDWPMPLRDQLTLSWIIGTIENRAANGGEVVTDRIEYRKSLGLPKWEYSFDSRCHDLAAIFLGDEPALHTPENINDLAQIIQSTIEEHIGFLRQSRSDNGQFGVGA